MKNPGYSYPAELFDAIDRTQRAGLSLEGFRPRAGKVITPELQIMIRQKIYSDVAKSTDPIPLVAGANSFDRHPAFLPWVAGEIDPGAVLTCGYIEPLGGLQVNYSKSDGLKWIKGDITAGEARIARTIMQCWITLPSLEIIDLSFPVLLAHHKREVIDLAALPFIAGDPNKTPSKLLYHPVIIGKAFVNRINGTASGASV